MDRRVNLQRRYVLLLHGWDWNQLPLVKVELIGFDAREFCVPRYEAPSDWLHFDFEPDVRELVLQSMQYDRVAMWSDPIEQLGLARADAAVARSGRLRTVHGPRARTA